VSDYAEHLVIVQKALGELNWLLPENRLSEAREKAILLEQAARAIKSFCENRGHAQELGRIARAHPNMQVLTQPLVFAHLPPWTDAQGPADGKGKIG
jgi:hypothetical protein